MRSKISLITITIIFNLLNFTPYLQIFKFFSLKSSRIPALKVNSICEGNFGDHQCGFRRNRSTIDHIFCIRQILEIKWEYHKPVHQLFIDFKKAYDSVRREVLYNILIEFGISRKLLSLIKMSLTETYSRVGVGKNVSVRFPIRNCLKQGDALSPMLFNFALE